MILGIDPSLNSTGWAVIDKQNNKYTVIDFGSVVAKAGGDAIEKIKNISTIVHNLIIKYDIKIVAIEESFVNKNASSSLKLGMVRGGCIAVSTMYGAQIFEYSAKEIKLAISGTGSAKKEQLSFMIQHIVGKKLDFKNDDESDAICVALTHWFKSK